MVLKVKLVNAECNAVIIARIYDAFLNYVAQLIVISTAAAGLHACGCSQTIKCTGMEHEGEKE